MQPVTLSATIRAVGLAHEFATLASLFEGGAGKHTGKALSDVTAEHHFTRADSHLVRAGYALDVADGESGELHLVHAAARLLAAAHCIRLDRESRGV